MAKSPTIADNATIEMAPSTYQKKSRMRPSLETAVHWFDGAGWVLVGALAVGVICTLIIVFMGIVKEGYWDEAREAAKLQIAQLEAETAASKAALATANVEIARAHARTDEAHASIAQANARAAELERDAANARLEQERLKAQLAWRQLSPSEREKLRDRLSQKRSGLTIAFVANDQEAMYVAMQIATTFAEAGWNPVNAQNRVYADMLVFGIHIFGTSAADVATARDAFKEAGITFHTQELPDPGLFLNPTGLGFGAGPPQPVTIVVGAKPPLSSQ